MSGAISTNANQVVGVVRNEKMQKMFEERLGRRAGQFTTSLISLVNNNKGIAECEPMTVIQAALTAASMDLPINQNLGVAYIVPYNTTRNVDGKWVKVKEAQFQMGWKGFVQLAQRSGLFKTINTTDVREGEVRSRDRMTGVIDFAWIQDDAERQAAPIVGYLAYFELLSGFSKSLFMSKAEVEGHADRYSQAYRGSKGNSNRSGFETPWQTDFDLMAQKTVLKLLLSKYGPLSTEMPELQTAIDADQSVDYGNGRSYVDNEPDVGASDEKKAAIIAASGGAAEADVVVDPDEVSEADLAAAIDEAAKEAPGDKGSRSRAGK